jgi:hypothetical protein
MRAVEYRERQLADRIEEINGNSHSRAVHSGKLVLQKEITWFTNKTVAVRYKVSIFARTNS